MARTVRIAATPNEQTRHPVQSVSGHPNDFFSLAPADNAPPGSEWDVSPGFGVPVFDPGWSPNPLNLQPALSASELDEQYFAVMRARNARDNIWEREADDDTPAYVAPLAPVITAQQAGRQYAAWHREVETLITWRHRQWQYEAQVTVSSFDMPLGMRNYRLDGTVAQAPNAYLHPADEAINGVTNNTLASMISAVSPSLEQVHVCFDLVPDLPFNNPQDPFFNSPLDPLFEEPIFPELDPLTLYERPQNASTQTAGPRAVREPPSGPGLPPVGNFRAPSASLPPRPQERGRDAEDDKEGEKAPEQARNSAAGEASAPRRSWRWTRRPIRYDR